MSRRTAKPAKKTKRTVCDQVYGCLSKREAELKAMPLDDLLTELGRIVGQYTVSTYAVFDGLPNEAGRAPGDSPDDRLWAYSIEYEMRRPGRPVFRCSGRLPEIFDGLHAAAVWATMGAIAWAGVPEQEEAA